MLGNSEQVVEATHAVFDKFWKKYLVADLESEIQGDRLLQCVIDFNSSNKIMGRPIGREPCPGKKSYG